MRAFPKCAAVCLLILTAARADVVHLTAGQKVEGEVLSVSRSKVSLLGPGQSERTFDMPRVKLIEFAENKKVTLTLKNKHEQVKGAAVSLQGGSLAVRDESGADKKFALMNVEQVRFLGVGKPFEVIARGGEEIDLSEVLVLGKITVIDFYADWCGPCRAIGPLVEQLPKEDPMVVVRKVDIVQWGSPVCRQFNINSVPNLRVFDAQGRQVGPSTSSPQRLKELIKEAKGAGR